ncbi:hypothetical protein CJA_0173 [Cellvibrio japonicus Ueda107]|uniref:Uncharacterized protein n=1 Tax=Cellvibrio japonicus (strain Ueda107) TaxID=498211 RepID=B3PGB8_CELJU|nr:hypothetical protein CJA_0173 [Cellvibrio japonicus Ueda107]
MSFFVNFSLKNGFLAEITYAECLQFTEVTTRMIFTKSEDAHLAY